MSGPGKGSVFGGSMVTYLFMAVLILFLAIALLYKAEYATGSTHLFNKQNSTAMRGFWCLIVILVHIPAAYQNRIQDMIGSFAYIGVTFFFMTSAYGLKLGIKNNPESIRHFWRKRLPKLLVPMFLVNMIAILFGFMENTSVSPWILIKVNGWVWWLLVCYVIFWTVNRFLAIRGRLSENSKVNFESGG